MNNSIYRFTLDLQKHNSQMTVPVYKYDNAVSLIISLTDGGKPYTIKEGNTAYFYGKRADDTVIIHNCEIKNATEIIYEFRNSTTFVSGVVECQIRVYGEGNKLITAPKFTIRVEDAVMDEDIDLDDGDVMQGLNEIFTAETIRIASEEERNQAEFIRVVGEDSRIIAEDEREAAEDEREKAEASRVTAEQARATDETVRVAAEALRVTAESGRADAESKRVISENTRVTAEQARATAESGRVNAESKRVGAENTRVSAEQTRVTAESGRVNAESKRVDAENARASAELARVTAENNRKGVFIRYSAYSDGTDFTGSWSSGKNYIGIAVSKECPTDKSGFVWCLFKGETGKPFRISKVYSSVAAMNADFSNTAVAEGEFVAIDTGNVNNADNAKLYLKTSTGFTFITDLSGAQGLRGEDGTSVTHEWNGTILTIHSASGTSSADLKGGKGDDGISVTHEWNGTSLKITSASGESDPVNLKGEPGDNGTSTTHIWNGTTLTIHSASGTSSADLKGAKGDPGIPLDMQKDLWKILAEKTDSWGLKYALYDDHAECIGIGNCTDTDVEIASMVKDLPVTTIGDYAFQNCSNLTSITIPNTVTNIGKYAFQNCTSLADIPIPNSVTSIGQSAFGGCTNLTSLTIPNSVTTIGGLLVNGCSNIENIVIGNGITSISALAFNKCTSLKNITIGNSVTSIGDMAFQYCSSLTSITIPDNVTSIGQWTFDGCFNLTDVYFSGSRADWDAITIGVGNSALTNATISCEIESLIYELNEDGASYKVTGVRELTAEKLEILSNYKGLPVTNIGEKAFSNCKSLKSITIPDSITSIGMYAFLGCSSLTKVYITDIANWCNISFADSYSNPLRLAHKLYLNGEFVTNLVFPDSVTSIGDRAFYACTSLEHITIPNSVTTIGDSAFQDCTYLTDISIPNTVTSIGDRAFYYCSSLTSVTIPDSVTSIGDYAFADCSSLTNITIPDSVTSIGYMAFFSCDKLTSVTIFANVSYGSYAFGSCDNLASVTISEGVTSISNWMFSGCESLDSITIPSSVKDIGTGAFYDCSVSVVYNGTEEEWDAISIGNNNDFSDIRFTALGYRLRADKASYEVASLNDTNATEIEIPSTYKGLPVTNIGDKAFSNCKSLKSITIPDSITSIGDYAFDLCVRLTSITIPDSVTSIGSYAFYNCVSLTSITIPDSVTSIGEGAFDSCTSIEDVYIMDIAKWCSISYVNSTENPLSYAKNLYINGELVTELVIPYGVTTIGDMAFYNCSCFTSITIPNSVTSIGDYAFYNCVSLTSITIPNSVTSIGTYAFYHGTSLTDIYYDGTGTQWHALVDGTNNSFLGITVHYYYG